VTACFETRAHPLIDAFGVWRIEQITIQIEGFETAEPAMGADQFV
jgi:hypothetical protein